MSTLRKQLLNSKDETIRAILKSKIGEFHSASKGYFLFKVTTKLNNLVHFISFSYDEKSNIDFSTKNTVRQIAQYADCFELTITKNKTESNVVADWSYNGDDEL